MVDYTKQDMSNIWGSTGDMSAPSAAKIQTGWVVEAPPRQYWNWLENRQDNMLAYLAQKGISEWDSTTEYLINKSYVQYNNVVYKCIKTATNVTPGSNSSVWVVAFVAPTGASEALKATTPAANMLPYYTSATAASTTSLTAFARTILDDGDAGTVRNTIGAQAVNGNLTALSGLSSSANVLPYFTGTNTAATTNLTAFARSFLDDGDAATGRGTLGLGSAATYNVTSSSNDTTTNALLKVGDYGIGSNGGVLTTFTTATDWAKPAGWRGFVNLANAVGVPGGFTGYIYYTVTARRDAENGYSCMAIQHSGTGRTWIGTSNSSNNSPTWYEVANLAGATFTGGVNAPSLNVSGTLLGSSEIQTTAIHSYRQVQGNYGTFWRNDGGSLYLMTTASGDQYGSYNSLRPFYVNLSSGKVTLGNDVGISGTTTFSGLVNVNSQQIITTSGSTGSLVINDSGSSGANIKLQGDGTTTPNKYLRAQSGNFQIINSAYNSPILTIADSGQLTTHNNTTVNGTLSVTNNTSITGSLTTQGTLSVSGTTNLSGTVNITSANNANIEFGYTGGAATTPFIDFHSGATSTDYDYRIVASGGNGSNAGGSLTLTGLITSINSKAVFNQSTELSAVGSNNAQHSLSAASGSYKLIRMATGGSPRWDAGSDNSSESGSNAGSNYYINRFNDSGSYLSTPFQINRSNGTTTIENVVVSGNLTVNGSITGSTASPTPPKNDNSTKTATTAYVYGQYLGSVSQSNGNPTGSILEKGSNSNGQYVRYADGTLICWGTTDTLTASLSVGVGYRSNPASVTFASAFSAIPVITLSAYPSPSYTNVSATGSLTVNSTTTGNSGVCLHILQNNTNVTGFVNYMAVGRWF